MEVKVRKMPKIKNIEKYLYLKKLDLKSLIINNDECIIYSLLDPINNEVKYIGKTDCIDRRYKQHLRSKSKSKVRSWIINICNKSMFPKLEIIDIVKKNEWAFWEQHYISLYKSWGFNLINSTIGGDNIVGYKHTEQTKDLIRAKMKGRSVSDDFRKLMSIIKKGRKLSPETIEKIKKSKKGSVSGDKHPMWGKHHKEESRKKISNSNKGKSKNQSEQGRKNISISNSKRRRKPVLQFDLDNNFIKRWESPICIEKELGLKKSCIIDACKKIRQITAYGYVWEYEK
jgi:hypothetical protein